MTRKDFVLISDVIRNATMGETERAALASQMATALYGTNPRFDRGRFERACEPREGGK